MSNQMGCVEVVNKYHFKNKTLPANAIFIGRPSLYGNPFSHLANSAAVHKVATRKDAVQQYAIWLAKAEEAEPIRQAIRKLARRVADGESFTLVCFCSPQACHGDIIRHHILRIAKDLINESAEIN